MPVLFAPQWKEIKVDYEAATDRKKPSEKFLGLFKKPTGLEAAFKSFDEALKKSDVEAAKKAYDTIKKAADTYQKTLSKAVAAEADKEIKKDTQIMVKKLDDLVEESDMAWQSMAKLPRIVTLKDFARLMKTPAGERVEEFLKKSHREETLKFLQAMIRKDYSVKVYKEFIKDNDINVSDKLIAEFKEDDLKNAPWDEAALQVVRLFNTNTVVEMNRQAGVS